LLLLSLFSELFLLGLFINNFLKNIDRQLNISILNLIKSDLKLNINLTRKISFLIKNINYLIKPLLTLNKIHYLYLSKSYLPAHKWIIKIFDIYNKIIKVLIGFFLFYNKFEMIRIIIKWILLVFNNFGLNFLIFDFLFI